MLKLYGLLSAKQRKEAFGEGTFVGAFNSKQKAALLAMLNSSDWLLIRGNTEVSSTDSIDVVYEAYFEELGKPITFTGTGVYKDGVRIDKDSQIFSAANMPVVVIVRGGWADEVPIKNPALAATAPSLGENDPESTTASSVISIGTNPSSQAYMMTLVFPSGAIAEFRIGDTNNMDLQRALQRFK